MKEDNIIIDSLKEIKEAKEYWLNIFSKPIEKLVFPRDFFGDFQYDEKKFNFVLSGDLYNKLNNITNGENLTTYTLLLSVFKIGLFKYNMQNDSIIGIPVYFKSKEEDSLNKVVLTRNYLEDNMTFKQVLLDLRKTIIETYKNQIVSLEEIVKHLNVDNDIMSLLPINFAMKNIHNEEHIEYIVNSPENEITFLIEKVNNTIQFEVIFNSKLFKIDTIQRFSDVYLNILYQVFNDLEVRLFEIEMLSEEEKHKLLYEFNDTYADYPRDKTIQELFEEQVEKTPDNIAIVFEDKRLTYRELNEKANRLARNLRKKGVKPDSIVGIMVERSLEMIVGMFGVLKAGGAYLPIDPEYPADRIRYMIEDSNTNVLLTQSNLIGKIEFHGEVIDLEDEKVYLQKVDNLEKINTAVDLAYVIYTSGSTGRPKGVMIEHRSIATTLQWRREEYKFKSDDSVLQLFSNAFDAFVTSFYTPIISGSKVVILSDADARDIFEIRENILLHKITHLTLVPSMCLMIIENLTFNEAKSLKVITLGGEGLTAKIVEKSKNLKEELEIVNEYGPTENSVITTIMRNINKDKQITIGSPKANTRIYILDKKNKLQAIGVPGEICISGDGLARGYLNNLELTAEKFIENPFVFEERIYKTGDLARWLPDGNIEFLGRIDHQVKIRGFRIELGEIESQLLNHESVKEVIVLDREDENGSKYLCAYLVSEKELTVGQLREYISKKLPEYMIPSYFVQLGKMPLTSNGKIDRKALPKPDGSIGTGKEYEAPRNEVEEKLVVIWSEILGIKKVGINDNFFELGGHSLKATILASRIYKELNMEVPLREIFKFSTIKGISEYIESIEKSIYSSIEIVEEKEYYEASSAQKRMYLLQQFDLKSTGYNMPGVMIVEGRLNVERLEKSFTELIRRHETLRTSFETNEDKIVQIVHESVNFKLNCFEVDFLESTDKTVDSIVKDFVKAFDLNKAPLLRVGLIKLEEEKCILMFDMHHIISDGVSMDILTTEFANIYEGNKLEGLRIQYKDYSQWQNSLLESEVMQKQKEYWINRFKDEIPVLNMPTDFKRPLIQSFEGENISFKLDKELTKNLRQISKETGSTMYMVFLSGVNILLSKYSGQEDIIVGSPIAGRPHADLEKIIGMFVNTLAMRNHPEGSRTYEDFLKEVKENALQAYDNQDYQFDELVDKLSIPKDISRNPLFDVMFTMQNMDSEEIELKDLVFKEYKQENRTAKFDLTFSASDMVENIILNLQYSTKLYKRETIEIMMEHFVNILKAIVADTKVKLSEIEMLTEEEKHKLLYVFNDTYVDYPRDKTIHELFEEQVQKTPDNIAIIFEEKKLTYRELNEKANKLARTLRGKGVRPDSIVGIVVDRSLDMIVGMLGVLKSGGAYLPIDPEYPVDRIAYMIKDSNTNILLTQSNLIGRVEFYGEVIDLEDEEVYSQKVDNLENINESGDLAYVIYTSGSTGTPKGVLIEHKGISNLQVFFSTELSIIETDKIIQFASNSFDASVWEIFMALLLGAELHMTSKEVINDYTRMSKFLAQNNITVATFPPNYIINLNINEAISLRKLITAGSSTSLELISKCTDKAQYVNAYGPTEATICSTIWNYNNEYCEPIITIGKSINNTKVYILDKKNKLQPIGVPGEICISGDGLARGYLNKLELTLEKFIESPFVSGERMYKTGDLARWLPDGNIEFLGRIDHQVKLRGFRIELGEIESQLLNHESVKEVIVIDREDENESKYLCAYLVSEKELTVSELRGYLLKKLPEYMIPSNFVQLEKMPLTPNGKIDRKALPEPDGSIVTGTEYEAPRNEVEEKLVAIWKGILAAERVGINDNFFELGGHSLKATTLVSRMHKELNVEVPLREIFKFPTIRGISEYIESIEKNIYSSIEIVEEKGYYEASSAQKRMYMLQQFDLKGTGYNMPGVMMVEGALSVERLEKSFTELISRHETLRTSFETIEDKVVQRINESVNFKLYCFEVGGLENQEKEVDNILKDFVKAFDLNKAPLLRVGLIKLEEDKHILMFDMHHIISDGVSMGILTNEFTKFYEGNKLEGLRIQYKDYSEWQNSLLKSDVMQEQKEYWINRYKDEIPVLNIRANFKRPLMKSFEGENISFKLDKELTKGLNRISKETGSTMYMVLLSGINLLLSKYSGQEDIIVGSPIAGRPHADLEKIIGIFVNTLAMRNYPEGNRTYEDFLKEVKENALKAYENQDYQFDVLVDQLSIPRDISRNPLFDVMFTMQNMDSEEIKLKDLVFKGYKQEHKVAKFDLTFSASDMVENIILNLQYNTKLYKRETIEIMIEHFINILKAVAADIKIKLSEIDMLTEGEKHKILHEFNDTYSDYPRDKMIHELFEEQAQKTPDNVAVVFEDKELTYRELNEKANKLARTLREKGVKPDSIVGIMVERSLEMIIGIMGVLKAGGAYLPIDPKYPEERINYMVEDGKVAVILIQSKLKEKITFKGELLDLEDEKYYGGIGKDLDVVNSSKDLAYVIYTSGSTGKPKGVMIEHKNVLNLTFALLNDIYSNYGSNLNIALIAPYVFDASVKQIFPAILLGHKLVIVPEEARTTGELLLEYYNNNLIDISDGTPIHMNMLANARHKENASLNVKCFIIGGDVLPCETVRKIYTKFAGTKSSIVNIYGPTECCVDSIFYDIDMNKIKDLEIIPIGKPMCNASIYILGKNLEILPVGSVGEIYIAGEGVGRGYLNKPKLTAEKFIANPFVFGERMYKTGDLGMWLPDGNIEFLGRIDHQVKIRGFRIELEEIESQLLNYEYIKEAIVLDIEDENGVKYLCAYLVSQKELKIGELRAYLAKKLPEYMIPSYFVQLEKMPLTSNGKLDRKALPKPDGSILTGTEYEAPRNEVEEKLAVIWSEVLGVEKVGINDNFFELGGHSLKAIILVGKIHKELDVEISISDIFKTPTIKGISNNIKNKEKEIYQSILKVEDRIHYPASHSQKRLFIVNKVNPYDISYNMTMILMIDGELDINRLEDTLENMRKRHAILRTSFKFQGGEVLQIIDEDCKIPVNSLEIANNDLESMVKKLIVPFDLSKAPLVKVNHIKTEENKQILIIDMHHIISDGISMKIFKNELVNLYQGKELKTLDIQYKDFSVWQNNYLNSQYIKRFENYWIENMKNFSLTRLPQKYYMNNGEVVGLNKILYFNKEATIGIDKLCKKNGITKFVYFTGILNIILMNETSKTDITIGVPTAGRNHNQVQNLIGLFLNVLVIRTKIDPSNTFKEYLKMVNENVMEAFNNQDYPYEELYDMVHETQNFKEESLFTVMLNYMPYQNDIEQEEINMEGITIEAYEHNDVIPKYDMTVYVKEYEEDIHINIVYKKGIYEYIIDRISKAFEYVSDSIIKNEESTITKINFAQIAQGNNKLQEFDEYFEEEDFFMND